jgi:hypothetical protein
LKGTPKESNGETTSTYSPEHFSVPSFSFFNKEVSHNCNCILSRLEKGEIPIYSSWTSDAFVNIEITNINNFAHETIYELNKRAYQVKHDKAYPKSKRYYAECVHILTSKYLEWHARVRSKRWNAR